VVPETPADQRAAKLLLPSPLFVDLGVVIGRKLFGSVTFARVYADTLIVNPEYPFAPGRRQLQSRSRMTFEAEPYPLRKVELSSFMREFNLKLRSFQFRGLDHLYYPFSPFDADSNKIY
jgi:hypothetical protein